MTPTDYEPGYFGEVYRRFEGYFWHIHGFPPSRDEVFARAYRWARRRESRIRNTEMRHAIEAIKKQTQEIKERNKR